MYKRQKQKSANAEASLTARLTGRAVTKVGVSDPVVCEWKDVYKRQPTENITLAIQAAQPAMSLTPENEEEDRQMDIPVESPEESLAERCLLYTSRCV